MIRFGKQLIQLPETYPKFTGIGSASPAGNSTPAGKSLTRRDLSCLCKKQDASITLFLARFSFRIFSRVLRDYAGPTLIRR